jgi:hypothetical protein
MGFDFWCFNATFNNISAISWRPVLVGGGSRREPPTMGNQLVSFITFGCESSAPFFIGTPDPKGHVRYCHHLASVRYLFHIFMYSSEATGPNGTKLGRKHLYKVLYKVSSFRPIPPTNMAANDNSCF